MDVVPVEDELMVEIDVMVYLTPPAETDGEEVDPLAALEEFEREENERLAMRRHDVNVLEVSEGNVEDVSMGDGAGIRSEDDLPEDQSCQHAEREMEDLVGGVDELSMDVSLLEDGDSLSYGSEDVFSELTEDMESADTDSTSAYQSSESDPSSDEVEFLWSGIVPWAEDEHASALNALLVHACNCEATQRCRDVRHRELCLPMKRLLRSACWASHNDRWLRSRVAILVASLLGYHSLHCEAQGESCTVPLCDFLRRLR